MLEKDTSDTSDGEGEIRGDDALREDMIESIDDF